MSRTCSTNAALDAACGRFRRALAATLFAAGSLRGLAGAAVVWGVAALAARTLTGSVPVTLARLAVLLLPAAAIAGLLAARALPPRHRLRACLDVHTQAGGLFVTAQHPGYDPWASRTAAPRIPAVCQRGHGRVIACLACLAFAAVVAWLPSRAMGPTAPSQLAVRQAIDALESQTDLLEEQHIVDAKDAEELRQQLESIGEQASGETPARTYAALDHVDAALRQEAAAAAEALSKQAEQMATFEALATQLGMLAQNGGGDSKELQRALTELAQALAADPSLAAAVGASSEGLRQALANAQLNPAQLAELARQLGRCQNTVQATVGKLCEARLLDPKALEKCKQAGNCAATGQAAREALLGYVAANPGTEASALLACMNPGNGGISRGGGPSAGLTWTTETTGDGAGFVERALPSAPGSLADAQLVGLTSTAPDSSGAATAPLQEGALAGTAPAAADAWRRTLLPRHRASVQRYFDR